jgi:Putative metallopeptidase
MLNYFKWLSGFALVSLFTIGDLPTSPKQVAQAQTPIAATATQTPPKIAQSQRNGRIKVVYGETSDSLSALLLQGYRQYRFFETAGKLITAQVKLPRNITVVLRDCGQANAAYIDEQKEIVMCNELTKHNYELFKQSGEDEETALKLAIFANIFTFYHEAAHMLISELDLPTVAKEEDAADQFAAYFLLSSDSSEDKSFSGEIVMSAAKFFALQSKDPDPEILRDPHSLDQQRFYNLVCILYGTDPEKYSNLVSSLDYSESRLNGCQQEVTHIFSAWRQLLAPYAKTASSGW